MRLLRSVERAAAAERQTDPAAITVILLVAFCLSIAVALLRGGSFSTLTGLSLRCGWVALVAFCAQALVIYNPLPRAEGLTGLHSLLLLGSYAVLILVVVLNRKVPGMPLVGIGLGMNLLVILLNGGFMPISWEALEQAGLTNLALSPEAGSRLMATKDVLLPRDQTRLWILSDILVIPAQLPLSSVFSVGDVMLACGIFWLFQRTMRAPSVVPTAG